MTSFSTDRKTKLCPNCGTGYTFRSEEKMQSWIANGRTEPLHNSCIQAKKQVKPLIDSSLTDVPTLDEKPEGNTCSKCGEVHDGDICPSQY